MEAPILGFNRARDEIVEEVVARACDETREPRLALSEAAFLEVKRQQETAVDDVVPLHEWRTLARSLGRMTDDECAARLRKVATAYARDIAGHFDPRVYKFASRAIAPLLGMLMSPRQTLAPLGGAVAPRAPDGRRIG